MEGNTFTVWAPPYTVGTDAYENIGTYCRVYGTKAVVIGGEKAMAAAREKLLAGAKAGGIAILAFLLYGKECTHEAADRLAEAAAVREADMIFAVGGGKAVDTAKLVSIALGKPYMSFPTIASNCAASSSLSIVYHEDGSFCEFVHFLDSARHVFIDTEIIAHAPKEYLWAGIGDTYAKYYEVSISARGESLDYCKAMGVHLSRMCMEILVSHGEQALLDSAAGIPSPALAEAALAIIITTGWVSMLVAKDHTMDYNGGVAHAFFYGLCNLPDFEKTHLHGAVVGFGVLVLLMMDGREEECARLAAFNKKVGLPTRLSDLKVTREDVLACAPAMTRDEDLAHYPYAVTVEMIMDAVDRLL